MNTQPKCSTCGKNLHGRKDKVFCNTTCKNKHHYEARQLVLLENNSKVKTINRNFIVLTGLFKDTTRTLRIHYKLLFKHHFDEFSSESTFIDKGKRYYKIRNFIFRRLKNGIIEIHRLDSNKIKSAIFFDRWEAAFGRIKNFFEESKVIINGFEIERIFFEKFNSTAKSFNDNS